MEITYYNITLVFGLSEVLLAVVKRSKKTQTKSKADQNSMLALWLCIVGGLVLGGFAPGFIKLNYPAEALVQKTGIAVFVVGIIIRWTAILQLGKMFTVDVSITSNHQLKTNGLYSIVRHPSYLGLLLILLGIGLMTGSVVSSLIVFVPSLGALIYRMQVEENALITEFGAEYLDYKARVARIIPKIY